MGFRDDFDAKMEDMVEHICAMEAKIDTTESLELIKEIREYARNTTYIVPHYIVRSKGVDFNVGKLTLLLNWARKMLIDYGYQPLTAMFPETVNWAGAQEKIVHVGIAARI